MSLFWQHININSQILLREKVHHVFCCLHHFWILKIYMHWSRFQWPLVSIFYCDASSSPSLYLIVWTNDPSQGSRCVMNWWLENSKCNLNFCMSASTLLCLLSGYGHHLLLLQSFYYGLNLCFSCNLPFLYFLSGTISIIQNNWTNTYSDKIFVVWR